ncbi:MAG: hypothetical protein AAFY76_15680 [Cyanobacteria bacterium J06649_11]
MNYIYNAADAQAASAEVHKVYSGHFWWQADSFDERQGDACC